MAFKKRAPRAIKAVREFAAKAMVSNFYTAEYIGSRWMWKDCALMVRLVLGYERCPSRPSA